MIWPHTVTVWHRAGDAWDRQIVRGACWQDAGASQLRPGADIQSCTAAVFLPAGTAVSPGDWVAKGAHFDAVRTAKDAQQMGARRVTAAEDNDFGCLQHVEVTLA